MKKLHRIVSAVVFGMISFAFISCSHQEMEGTDVGVLAENQFYASFYDNSSKVVMDSGYNLSWEKGDLVSVFDEDGNNMLFTADESAQNTALTGSVDIDETASYYAAFPYAETNSISGSTVSLTISPVQKPRLGSFPVNYAVAKSERKTFVFYNICGLVGFEITEDDIASVTVTPNEDGECLSGKISVDCSDVTAPSYELEEGIREVTLVADDVFGKGYHYVAVLPQVFEKGITVTMYKKDGTQAKKTTTKGFTLNRSRRIDTKQIDADQDWTNVVLITSAGDLQGFLATADALTSAAEVRLINDIDLKGYEMAPAKSFAGTFTGNSNSILNWNTTTPLFGKLTSTAVVNDLVIDKTCSLEVQPTGDAAFVTLLNEGVISGCVNNGNVTTVSETFTSKSERRIGSLAAVSTGSMVSCINNGSVTINPPSINMAATQYVGGVAGQASASVGQNAMEGCINNGTIAVKPTGFSCRLFIGGVCGGTPAAATLTDGFTFGDYGSFSSCRNTAEVTLVNNSTSKKTTYINMGGVIGYAEASLSNCDNEGAVTATLKTSASQVKYSYQRPAIGGVAGTVLYNVDGCDNAGTLNVQGMFGESNPEVYASDTDRDKTGVGVGQYGQASFGGVVAVAGCGSGSTLTNCTNSAAVTLDLYGHADAVAEACAGGVAGYADASVSNCTFSGKSGLEVKNRMHCGHVGGIVGLAPVSVTSCESTAPLLYDFVNTTASGYCSASANVGGVVGHLSSIAESNVITYSSSTGTITVLNGYRSSTPSSVGGLVGRSAKGRVLGCTKSSEDKEVVEGTITVDSPAKVYAGGIAGSMGYGYKVGSKGLYGLVRQGNIILADPGAGSRAGGACGYRYSAQNDALVDVMQSKITVGGNASDVYAGQLYGEYVISSSDTKTYQIHTSEIDSPDISADNAAAVGIVAGKLICGGGSLQLGKSGGPLTLYSNVFNGTAVTGSLSSEQLAFLLVGECSGSLLQNNVAIAGYEDHPVSGTLPQWRAGYLDIHFINTGTGECSFIIMPDGTQMLVDVASANTRSDDVQTIEGTDVPVFIPRVPDSSRRPSEWINMYLSKCMTWTGNDKLDYISITHFDSDHIGGRTENNRVDGLGGSASVSALASGGYQKIGLAEILDGNNVGVLVDRAYPDYDYPVTEDLTTSNKMKNYHNAIAYHVTNRGMSHEAFVSGVNDQFVMKYASSSYPDFEIRNVACNGYMWTGPGTSVKKTFPDNSSYIESVESSMPNENMNSTAFKLSYGKFDYYAGGDLECDENVLFPWRNTEKPVADAVGKVEVMKANHHGSVGDNSQYLLDKLNPQAIIVNTWRKVQPRASTYERLKTSGADLFTTNLDAGYAANYSDGGDSIDSAHGHYVVRVSPGGEVYYIYALDDMDTSMGMIITRRFGPYLCE